MLEPRPILLRLSAALASLLVLFAIGLHMTVQFNPGTPCIFESLRKEVGLA